LHGQLKFSGTKTEILSFKLIRKSKEGRMLVFVKANFRQTVEDTKSESAIESHEILMTERGKLVSLLSLSKQ
jgi:hypothetical protein